MKLRPHLQHSGLMAVLAVLCTAAAVPAVATDDPWFISTEVIITEPMDVGNVIVVGDGRLVVDGVKEPGLRITGNLWATGNSSVLLKDSVIQFMSTYHGQYSLAATDNSSVEVAGCDYGVPNQVQHALVAAGSSTIEVHDTDFGDIQLLAGDSATLRAERLNGHFETLILGAGRLELADIPRDPGAGDLWVWPEFPEGSEAVYSPPMPGIVESWDFPPPGSSGIPQTCHLERCMVKLWPMLVWNGCRLTLRDIPEDNWVVVGLHMPTSAVVRGLVNQTPGQSRELPLSDRTVILDNASIDTWNLYPESHEPVKDNNGVTIGEIPTRVEIHDSVLGEVLTFGNASTILDHTTVDGSGGYFGANGSAHVNAYDSTFTCTIQASGGSTIELHSCSVEPYPGDVTGAYTRFGAYDDARLFADQTPVLKPTPALGGNGLIAVTWIQDAPSSPPPGAAVTLHGIAALFSLAGGLTVGHWRLEAVPRWSHATYVLGQGDAGNEDAKELGTWGGADPLRNYSLRLTLTDGLGRQLVGAQEVPGTGMVPPSTPGTATPRRSVRLETAARR
jgi:hypothetical protein